MYQFILAYLGITSAVMITSKVQKDMNQGGQVPFLVQLKPIVEQPSLESLASENNDGFSSFHRQLRTFASTSQKSLMNKLDELKKSGDVSYVKSYYISNTVSVVGSKKAIDEITKWDNVEEISSNRNFKIKPDQVVQTRALPPSLDQPHWSLKFINATNLPVSVMKKAEKLIYANADSGVDFTHEAIAKNYRGNKGRGRFDHNYSWFDAIKKPIGNNTKDICPIDSKKPCDDTRHGTHTMSTTVGVKNLGVSPTTRWIACRNMDQGLGNPESYLSCLQFLIAPTDLNGENPNPSLRPHVIGNSYGCPDVEGCSPTTFRIALQNLKKAGIFMSVSAGNEGDGGCGTVLAPPASDPGSFVVASSGFEEYKRSYFSSIGPVKGRKNAIDVTAPGSQILGAIPGNKYEVLQGTSMASPHVSGAALLVMAACPKLLRNVDAVQNILRRSATPVYSSLGCGGDNSKQSPNNEYGSGIINVAKAIKMCQAS